MFSRVNSIDGIALPKEFENCTIVNKVAISADGMRYAVVNDGKLITGQIPENGELDINGTKIRVAVGEPAKGGRTQSTQSFAKGRFSFAGLKFNLGSVFADAERLLPHQVEHEIPDVEEVIVDSLHGSIELGISDDDGLHLKGELMGEPHLSNGVVTIGNFDGIIAIPRRASQIKISTLNGTISGQVSAAGEIRTTNGSINISVESPLRVTAGTLLGGIEFEGFMAAGKNGYVPPGTKASDLKLLQLETLHGDIKVRYAGV